VFKTNSNAPKYKLVSINLNDSNTKFVDLIPENDDVLQDVRCVNNDKLIIIYMHDCRDEMYLYDLITGKKLKKIDLDIGSVLEISCRKIDNFFFFKFASFTIPGDIFQYRFDNLKIDDIEPKIYIKSKFSGLDLDIFKTEQVFYQSKDGTRIPMFIISKKVTINFFTNYF
jgi:prolyl oligopeptidase